MREESKRKTELGKLCGLLVIFALCLDQSFAAEGKNADAIVDSLQKNYEATVDFVADFRLEPKGESGGFSEILLGVAKNSSDILWVSVRDATNNLTTIRLSGMRKGVGLKDSLFRLEVPKGVDVVELGQ